MIPDPTRILFFTGKGGVGKTSAACATAIGFADRGRRVLLVSTDPASNLDEVLGVTLDGMPHPIPGVAGLDALNIDPEEAARLYRERVVGPYRGLLPASAIKSMEEQLSGACTVEIAAFDEFSKLLGDEQATATYDVSMRFSTTKDETHRDRSDRSPGYGPLSRGPATGRADVYPDHIIFDTAPTGHTLRLLELPAAWNAFIDTNVGGTSCLGPLSGLAAQKALYAASNAALRDLHKTTLVLVARPEKSSLTEAERTRQELAQLGMVNVVLVLNGIFSATDPADPIAVAMETRAKTALAHLPDGLASLPRREVPLLPFGLVGLDALRAMARPELRTTASSPKHSPPAPLDLTPFIALVDAIAAHGAGVVMTMGKGGVGKTTVAVNIAVELARRGFDTTLTTTDPAAHVEAALREIGELGEHGSTGSLLRVTRIDPAAETRRYSDEVMATAGKDLDAQGKALLAEDLRSPCTEEIAVFRAFSDTVAEGLSRFVVIDTAPTGHTLLLLDSAEAYHREVLKKPSGNTDAVLSLLPRLRDRDFTHVLLVTLPEATPIHEAMQLERDLRRADIHPFAWVVNQSLTPLAVTDPVLVSRRQHEAPFLAELAAHADKLAIIPWRNNLDAASLQPSTAPHQSQVLA